MRRFALWMAALGLFLGGLLWLLREGGVEVTPPAAASEDPSTLSERLRQRIEQGPVREELEADGSLELRGTVIGADGVPVGGALVSLTPLTPEVRLTRLPCACADSCQPAHLLDGSCPEAPAALFERVARREGEPEVQARTTSAADGTFVLRGLEAQTYRVWAESERGIATLEVPGNQQQVLLTLSTGWMLTGKVRGEQKDVPLAGAVITAVDSERGRYYDTLTGPDGSFSVGPLPTGAHLVVASQGALIPNAEEVTPETAHRGEPLVLETPRRISGRVVRDDDAPVQGALVTLSGMHRSDTVRTSEAGTFSLERLRSGAYALVATQGELSGHGQAHLGTVSVEAEVVIRLAEGAVLVGTVKDTTGAPVPQARVTASTEALGLDPSLDTVSDGEGNFRLEPLPPGETRVTVSAEGYLQTTPAVRVLVAAGPPARAEVTVERANRVSGQVVDDRGKPVNGAKVVAGISSKGADEDTTGEEGRFELTLATGTARLTIKHPGFRDHRQEVGSPAAPLRIVLDRGLQLRGKVLDPQGAPLRGAKVLALAPGRSDLDEGRDLEREGTSGEDGSFSLGGLIPGAFLVAAMQEEGDSEERSLRMGATQVTLPFEGEVVVRLRAGQQIAGRVVDQHGQPVSGARLFAKLEGLDGRDTPPVNELLTLLEGGAPFSQALSDPEGRFALKSLRPGRFELTARAEGLAALEQPASAGEQTLRLVMQRYPRLSGRVVGEEGRPLRRFRVNLTPVEASDGRFSISTGGQQNFSLRISAPDHVPWSRELQPGADGLDVGEVRLSRGASLTGRVVDGRSGAPVSGALVGVGPPPRNNHWQLSVDEGAVRSGSDGSFRVRNVDRSTEAHLFAFHRDYVKHSAPLEGTLGEPLISLTRLGTLRGKVVLPGSLPAGSTGLRYVRAVQLPEGMAAGGARPDPQGGFEFQVPPGSYRLETMGALQSEPLEVSVAEGAVISVELRAATAEPERVPSGSGN